MWLYSWNVNGVRACWNKGQLEQFLKRQPEIVCLQEVKASQEQSPLPELGYHHYWSASLTRKGYSGTAILSRQPALSVSRDFPESISSKFQLEDSFGDSNREGRLLTLEFDNFYLVNVYSPNSKGDLSRLGLRTSAWDPALASYCQDLLTTNKSLLVTGDLNVAHQPIDLARPEANHKNHGFTREERASFSNLLAVGLVDSFRHLHPDKTQAYSWWSAWGQARQRNIGWRIDYWLVDQTSQNRISQATIEADVMGSDHCPIGLEIDWSA